MLVTGGDIICSRAKLNCNRTADWYCAPPLDNATASPVGSPAVWFSGDSRAHAVRGAIQYRTSQTRQGVKADWRARVPTKSQTICDKHEGKNLPYGLGLIEPCLWVTWRSWSWPKGAALMMRASTAGSGTPRPAEHRLDGLGTAFAQHW